MSRDERVTNFEVETGTKLDRPKIHTTTWAEKQAFVKSERKRLAKIDDRVTETKYDFSEPKQSILQKISGFFKNIWKNANT